MKTLSAFRKSALLPVLSLLLLISFGYSQVLGCCKWAAWIPPADEPQAAASADHACCPKRAQTSDTGEQASPCAQRNKDCCLKAADAPVVEAMSPDRSSILPASVAVHIAFRAGPPYPVSFAVAAPPLDSGPPLYISLHKLLI